MRSRTRKAAKDFTGTPRLGAAQKIESTKTTCKNVVKTFPVYSCKSLFINTNALRAAEVGLNYRSKTLESRATFDPNQAISICDT